MPCAHFYPAHPMKDAFGAGRSYEGRYHTAFQDSLFRFGDDQLVDLKNRMLAAVSGGHDPSAFPVRGDRFARATIRIGLRQLLAEGGPSPVLAAWLAVHDHVHHDDAKATGLEPEL